MSIQSGWWEIQNLLGGFLPFSGKLLIMKLLPARVSQIPIYTWRVARAEKPILLWKLMREREVQSGGE